MGGSVLFADRFLLADDGRATDLATGRVAWVRAVRVAGDGWFDRCRKLADVDHPHLVGLADYGLAGCHTYFEAWDCDPPPFRRWRARDAATASALHQAVACLCAHGVACGRLAWSQVVDRRGSLAIRLDEDPDPAHEPIAGEGLARQAERLDRMLRQCGVGPGDRIAGQAAPAAAAVRADEAEVMDRLADVLAGGVAGRPRALALSLQDEGRWGRMMTLAARCARTHGYVPLHAALLTGARSPEQHWLGALQGRHILLMQADERPDPDVAMFLVSLGAASDRPHVWLRLGAGHRGAPRLVPLPARAPRSSALQLREERAPYLVEPRPSSWEAEPGEARKRVPDTRAEVERRLRDALGRCARRADDEGAGEAGLALGQLWLVRGRAADAVQQFGRARESFERARRWDRALAAGVYGGLAATDAGQFTRAEASLRAVDLAAGELSDTRTRVFAKLALGRALLWQDRPADALEVLGPIGSMAGSDGDEISEWRRLGAATCARERAPSGFGVRSGSTAVRWPSWSAPRLDVGVARACLMARCALSRGDLAAAGRSVREARERASAGGPWEVAALCRARAAFAGAVGDLDALRVSVAEGLEAARRSHDPLGALRLRVTFAAAMVGEGRRHEAGALVARLARLDPRGLPAVVGLRVERLQRMIEGVRPPAEPAGGGMAGASAVLVHPSAPASVSAVDAGLVADLLAIAQSQDDERVAMRRVACVVRQRLRASCVVGMAGGGEASFVLVHEGADHLPEDVGRRAMDAGIAIPPTATRSGLDAAVPVRLGETTIGALACRWAADAPPCWPSASAVMWAAAAVAAPSLRAWLDRREEPAAVSAPGDLIGTSEAIETLRREVARAAVAPFNVVIEGESGSGKELVARAIHRIGPRCHRPLCALNCAALSDDLVEAELFGHARGAFTGAQGERRGLFEEAHDGILFLDEVAELTPRAQAKLLRAIQEGEIRRLGENVSRPVNVRIVAATNRPLRAAVEAGLFRHDLRYRLEVVRIVVPPLRARAEDIAVLAAHFWRDAAARVESRCTLAPDTLAALARYDWPGNVRELQNVMAALAVTAGRRGRVTPDRLPEVIAGQAWAHGSPGHLDEARRSFDTRFVRAALARAGGRRAQAAAELGVTRQGLAKLMARLGLE